MSKPKFYRYGKHKSLSDVIRKKLNSPLYILRSNCVYELKLLREKITIDDGFLFGLCGNLKRKRVIEFMMIKSLLFSMDK